MNTKMKLRSAIAILLSALLILSIAGCSKKVPKKEEKKPPKPKKVTEQQEKNRKAAQNQWYLFLYSFVYRLGKGIIPLGEYFLL